MPASHAAVFWFLCFFRVTLCCLHGFILWTCLIQTVVDGYINHRSRTSRSCQSQIYLLMFEVVNGAESVFWGHSMHVPSNNVIRKTSTPVDTMLIIFGRSPEPSQASKRKYLTHCRLFARVVVFAQLHRCPLRWVISPKSNRKYIITMRWAYLMWS